MKYIYIYLTISTLILTLVGCSNKSVEDLLAESVAARQDNKPDSAILALKNALVIDPNSLTVREALADVYLTTGDYTSALKELRKAIELSEGNDVKVSEFNGKRAQALYFQNEIDRVIDIHKNESGSNIKRSGELTFFTGLSYLRLGQDDRAKQMFKSGTPASSVNNFDSFSPVYITLLEKGPEEALLNLKALTAEAESHFSLNFVTADVLLRARNYEHAIEALYSLTKARPKDLMLKIVLTDTLIRAQKYDEAWTASAELREAIPKNPLLNQLSALISMSKKDYESAVLQMDIAIQNGLTSKANYTVAGIANFRLEKYEASMGHFEKALYLAPESPELQRMFITNSLMLGNEKAALDTIASITNPDNNFFDLYADATVQLKSMGMLKESQFVLEKFNDLQSKNDDQALIKNMINLSFGDESSLSKIEQLLNEKGSKGELSLIPLVKLYIAQGFTSDAINLAKSILENNQKNVDAYNLLASAYYNAENIAEAKRVYAQALEIDPNNTASLLFLADESNDLDSKYDFLLKAYKAQPYSDNVMGKLLALVPQGLPVKKIFSEMEKQSPKSDPELIFHKSHMAYLYLISKNYEMALKELESISPSNNIRTALFWFVKGESEFLLSDFKAAYGSYSKLAMFPNTKRIGLFKKIFALETDAQFSRGIIDTNFAIKAYPEDYRFQLIKAHLQILAKRHENAEKTMSNIPLKFQSSPVYQQLEGRLLAANEKYAAALPKLLTAYENNPDSISAMYIYGIYREQRQRDEAISFLEAHIADFPNHMTLRLVLADIYMQSELSKAEGHYKQIIDSGITSPLVFNNLAWIALNKGKLGDAETYVQKALQISPNDPNILETAGDIKSKQGDTDKAIGFYYKASQIRPSSELTRKMGL